MSHSNLAVSLIQKANSLLSKGLKKQCADIIADMTKTSYSDALVCADIALIFSKLEKYQESKEYYLKAINIKPEDASLHFNLASVQRFLGDTKESELSLNRAIKYNPNDYEAYLLRASLRQQTKDNNHISEMEKILALGDSSPLATAQLCYALAKEEEDIQQYKKSFNHLKQGADSRRKNMQYHAKNDLNTISKIIEVFNHQLLNNTTSGYDNDEPIFILGLPRTGSTLIERIMSSHDQVYSAGELNNFAIEMMQQCKKTTSEQPKSREALVELTGKLNFTELGKNYIQSTRPNTGKSARFIDKLPLNSLYIGLIHLALPKAKIIHITRNPMDTCYSIFKQLFTNGYPFSYNLDELSEYYVAHHRLMAHWKKVLPSVIYTIQYEDVVSNIRDEAEKLIAHCQLDWQQQCCDFHLNMSPAVTASATQVRQSIYTSSLNKWRHYEEQLKPIINRFVEAGIDYE